jgi:hypothetical protein
MKLVKIWLKAILRPFGAALIAAIRFGSWFGVRPSLRVLVVAHLLRSGNPSHPNKAIFIKVLKHFEKRPLVIVETGTSAWGADSTRLWDQYIRCFGGELKSVDLRSEPSHNLRNKTSPRTHLTIGDSVEFLSALRDSGFQADLIYLDSFDVDWRDPNPAEQHGLKEFLIAREILRNKGIILIDDTPTSASRLRTGLPPIDQGEGVRGKGALALSEVNSDQRFTVLHHDYAVALVLQ